MFRLLKERKSRSVAMMTSNLAYSAASVSLRMSPA
jgi:hypothetical protein